MRIKDLDPTAVLENALKSPEDIQAQMRAADVEIASGLNKSAFERMIRIVKNSEGDEKKASREHLLQLFSLVDPQDLDLIQARKELASALY